MESEILMGTSWRWKVLVSARSAARGLWLGVLAAFSACSTYAQTANDAEFVSQRVPQCMLIGRTYPVSITMKNVGTQTWTAGAGYRLASQSPDNVDAGPNHVSVPNAVAPGEEVTFSFNITPRRANYFDFSWRMLQEGVGAFGQLSPALWPIVGSRAVLPVADAFVQGGYPDENRGTWAHFQVKRSSTSTNRQAFFRFDTSSVPGAIERARLCIYARLTHAGTVAHSTYRVSDITWSETGITWNNKPALGSSTDTIVLDDHINWSWYGWSVSSYLQSERAAGRNTISIGMWRADSHVTLLEGNTREASSNQPELLITLTNDAQFVSQSVPSTVTAGESFPVTVRLKNTGASTWTGAESYRLGSQNPQDNTVWGVSRANVPAAVAPGDEAVITFNATAPVTPGAYNFQWRMLREGVEWFGDTTPNVAVTVNAAPGGVGGFNAFESSTAAAAITGVIRTKVAGSSFSLAVIALNAERTAVLTAFTGDVKVDVLDASNNSGALDANGCRSSWTQIQTQTTTFSGGHNGRRNMSFTVSNAHRNVRIRLSFPTTGTPTAIGCSSDNFAVRPSGFTLSVTDADWETSGTTRTLDNTSASGGVVHKAGRPFRIAATAVNASAGTTTNYDGLPTPSFTYVLPAGASGGSLAVTPTVSGGIYVATATFSEAGVIRIRMTDSSFADVDLADSSDAERHVVSSWVDVGRFVPDHFALSADTTPQFRTFNDASCAARSFTYTGQRFGYVTAPRILIQPRNAAGASIANYTGSLWKIAAPGVAQTYSHSVTGGSSPGLDESGAKQAATVVSNANGTGTASVNVADLLAFARANTPHAPFTAAISLAMNVSDPSEAGVSGNGTISASAPLTFSNIAFDAGNEFRYGRLRLQNAHGSALSSLPILIQAQYWNGTAFVTNTADHCTTINPGSVALGNFQRALGAGHTLVSAGGRFNSGVGSLRLSAPGETRAGSVDLSVNLGASSAGASCVGGMPSSTPSGLAHLQGAWCGAAYDRDPTARVTFGVYRAPDRVLYRRENF